MASVIVIVDGLPQLERRLFAVGNIGNPTVMSALGKQVVEKAQAIVPVSKDGNRGLPPGQLRDSIKVEAVTRGRATIVAGGEVYPAARAVEFGTSQRRVYPNRSRRLAFFWKKEGRQFVGSIGQSVDHPAQTARPFLRPALDSINFISVVRALVVEAWNNGA